MKQHKWHKEIKAWADGAEIEWWSDLQEKWEIAKDPVWSDVNKYRIKPQLKETQYLYVYEDDIWVDNKYENEGAFFSQYKLPNSLGFKYIGKIKIEVEE